MQPPAADANPSPTQHAQYLHFKLGTIATGTPLFTRFRIAYTLRKHTVLASHRV